MASFAALWISLAACIPTYMLASSLIGGGMSWWQAVRTIFLGNLIVLVPMILNAHAGTKYGIPFPVYCRAARNPPRGGHVVRPREPSRRDKGLQPRISILGLLRPRAVRREKGVNATGPDPRYASAFTEPGRISRWKPKSGRAGCTARTWRPCPRPGGR